MKNELYLLLFQPGEFFAPRSVVTAPSVILRCDIEKANIGNNALFHQRNDLIVDAMFSADKQCEVSSLAYQFHYFSADDRALKQQSAVHFDEMFAHLTIEERSEHLMPALAVKLDAANNKALLYHFNDTGSHGSLMIKYAEIEYQYENAPAPWELCNQLIEQVFPRLTKFRHLLNDTCWYTRWKHDMELERKFTFTDIPNTWELNTKLHQEINQKGLLPGYVPEIDMDLQVSDYGNHIFEVIEPTAKGYISFIPQTNHKVAIKQKWFEQNAELRKETINYDMELPAEEFEAKAQELAGGEVKRLASFRRKRFDINFESLESGNIFGVYFDICRSLDEPEKYGFSQCEVEYCRSRTMHDYVNVMEEFEQVCSYVENFLKQQNVSFEQNLYSKLDFARETYNAMQQGDNE